MTNQRFDLKSQELMSRVPAFVGCSLRSKHDLCGKHKNRKSIPTLRRHCSVRESEMETIAQRIMRNEYSWINDNLEW